MPLSPPPCLHPNKRIISVCHWLWWDWTLKSYPHGQKWHKPAYSLPPLGYATVMNFGKGGDASKGPPCLRPSVNARLCGCSSSSREAERGGIVFQKPTDPVCNGGQSDVMRWPLHIYTWNWNIGSSFVAVMTRTKWIAFCLCIALNGGKTSFPLLLTLSRRYIIAQAMATLPLASREKSIAI